MALIYRLFIFLFLTESFAAVSRKPPSFATPVYSNSYLPASMQVIFHTVEQLKAIDEISQNNSSSSSSTTIIPHEKDIVGITISSTIQTLPPQSASSLQNQQGTNHEPNKDNSTNKPLTVEETSHIQSIDQTTQSMLTSSNSESSQETSLTFQATGLSTDRQTITTTESEIVHRPHVEPLEINEETPEINYATPEMNHELPEILQLTQTGRIENFTLSTTVATISNSSIEKNNVSGIGDYQKDQGLGSTTISSAIVVEKNKGEPKINATKRVVRLRQSIVKSSSENVQDQTNGKKDTIKKKLTLGRRGNEELNKKKPTVDSIVNEIYDIVKPITTPSSLSSSSSPSSVMSSLDDFDDVTLKDTTVKLEVLEEEAEEIRFTLLGEKVAQVPRPSLTSYLRLAKVPPKGSIQQLATLYDALSKDARNQGFGRYAGYSNEVLKILETSSKSSGVAQQMKILFDKIVEKKELTRDETKSKISSVLKELNDSSSSLNQDLKDLRPLTYVF